MHSADYRCKPQDVFAPPKTKQISGWKVFKGFARDSKYINFDIPSNRLRFLKTLITRLVTLPFKVTVYDFPTWEPKYHYWKFEWQGITWMDEHRFKFERRYFLAYNSVDDVLYVADVVAPDPVRWYGGQPAHL